ncbi:hypothetical protein PybrP1_008842 [[Pythium] brassicae (nom. inval.)]|nr:hypothetical protein PybrP1_008842 [[Pythium] brassicae (nom. inval.)]
MPTTTKVLAERVLAALYARQPSAKVAVAATGGGCSAAELLFGVGSSSTMLHFAVPYARASLQSFLGSDIAEPTKFCSRETAERMAAAARAQALDIVRREHELEGDALLLPQMLGGFRASVGVGCTAALATNYAKQGPHQCFLSICTAGVVGESAGTQVLGQQCATYHLNLSKALKRTRSEEDHIVGHWLVYLLAKAVAVDPDATRALHDALIADQREDDRLTALHVAAIDSPAPPPRDPLQELCVGSQAQLTSVAFLPDGPSTVAVERLGFRGVVLSGSFNPLHQGHVALARAAQRLLQARTGARDPLPVAFEIAVANADKGAIAAAAVLQRVAQFTGSGGGGGGLGRWPVLVTNATLFTQKASLLSGCAFVIGADTAVRIVDKKYYGDDEHAMVLTLQEIARRGCVFVVAGRFDDKVAHRYVSAEEVLRDEIPAVFSTLFVPLGESDFRSDLSSTQLREQQQQQTLT